MADPTCRITIIEDEIDVQRTIVAMLAQPHFEVAAFSAPLPALDHIARTTPDIVISDLLMAEMDGIEVIRKVRMVSPSTRIIAISGAPSAYLTWAHQLGADAVISKPFRRQKLVETIESMPG